MSISQLVARVGLLLTGSVRKRLLPHIPACCHTSTAGARRSTAASGVWWSSLRRICWIGRRRSGEADSAKVARQVVDFMSVVCVGCILQVGSKIQVKHAAVPGARRTSVSSRSSGAEIGTHHRIAVPRLRTRRRETRRFEIVIGDPGIHVVLVQARSWRELCSGIVSESAGGARFVNARHSGASMGVTNVERISIGIGGRVLATVGGLLSRRPRRKR